MLPLSLLLLLASSTSLPTLASIPPDPFSHPKYSLSFLNDLPIEHSQAQRWIANGLPSSDSSTGGGVDVFFGAVESKISPERMELDEKETMEVEKLVGGGEKGAVGVDELDAQLSSLSGDGLEQIILSSPSTPPSDVQDSSSTSPTSPPTSNYTLQQLLLPPGPRSYLCLLPPPPQPLSALPAPPPVPPMDPSLPEKLLSHLAGGCLYVSQVCLVTSLGFFSDRRAKLVRAPKLTSRSSSPRPDQARMVQLRLLSWNRGQTVQSCTSALASSAWRLRSSHRYQRELVLIFLARFRPARFKTNRTTDSSFSFVFATLFSLQYDDYTLGVCSLSVPRPPISLVL